MSDLKKNDSYNNVILINFKNKKKINKCVLINRCPQIDNTNISLNDKKCSLHLKRTDNSFIMLRDINLYLAISNSISYLALKVPS